MRAVVLTHTGTDVLRRRRPQGAGRRRAARQQGTRRMLALLRHDRRAAQAGRRPGRRARCAPAASASSARATSRSPAGRASFAFTEVRLGLAPAIISLTTLGRMTERAAARYFLTGETFDAAHGRGRRAGHRGRRRPRRRARRRSATRCAACSPQGLAETKPLTTRRRAGRVRRARRRGAGAVGAAVRVGGGARGDARVPAEAAAPLGRRHVTTTRGSRTAAGPLAGHPRAAAGVGDHLPGRARLPRQHGRRRRRARRRLARRGAAPLPDPRGAVHRGARARHQRARRELRREVADRPGAVRHRRDRRARLRRCSPGTLFRAALDAVGGRGAEPQLRAQIVPLEARIGREIHRVVVELLGVDERVPGVRETVQATLDLARGLGLANLLTDDSRAAAAGIAAAVGAHAGRRRCAQRSRGGDARRERRGREHVVVARSVGAARDGRAATASRRRRSSAAAPACRPRGVGVAGRRRDGGRVVGRGLTVVLDRVELEVGERRDARQDGEVVAGEPASARCGRAGSGVGGSWAGGARRSAVRRCGLRRPARGAGSGAWRVDGAARRLRCSRDGGQARLRASGRSRHDAPVGGSRAAWRRTATVLGDVSASLAVRRAPGSAAGRLRLDASRSWSSRPPRRHRLAPATRAAVRTAARMRRLGGRATVDRSARRDAVRRSSLAGLADLAGLELAHLVLQRLEVRADDPGGLDALQPQLAADLLQQLAAQRGDLRPQRRRPRGRRRPGSRGAASARSRASNSRRAAASSARSSSLIRRAAPASGRAAGRHRGRGRAAPRELLARGAAAEQREGAEQQPPEAGEHAELEALLRGAGHDQPEATAPRPTATANPTPRSTTTSRQRWALPGAVVAPDQSRLGASRSIRLRDGAEPGGAGRSTQTWCSVRSRRSRFGSMPARSSSSPATTTSTADAEQQAADPGVVRGRAHACPTSGSHPGEQAERGAGHAGADQRRRLAERDAAGDRRSRPSAWRSGRGARRPGPGGPRRAPRPPSAASGTGTRYRSGGSDS